MNDRETLTVEETALNVKRAIAELKEWFTPEELEALIAKINREETVKPLIDPTYYIRYRKEFGNLKAQVEALQKVMAT